MVKKRKGNVCILLFFCLFRPPTEGLSKGVVGAQYIDESQARNSTLSAAAASAAASHIPQNAASAATTMTAIPNSIHFTSGGVPLPTLTPLDMGANGTLLKYQTLPTAHSPNSTPATSTYGVKSSSHYG